jgi:hypothetical protein
LLKIPEQAVRIYWHLAQQLDDWNPLLINTLINLLLSVGLSPRQFSTEQILAKSGTRAGVTEAEVELAKLCSYFGGIQAKGSYRLPEFKP